MPEAARPYQPMPARPSVLKICTFTLQKVNDMTRNTYRKVESPQAGLIRRVVRTTDLCGSL
jgi:hypothetical protein